MGKGKLAAQACHASIESYKRTPKEKIKKWEKEGSKKIILKVKNLEELIKVYETAKKKKIPHYLVRDAGHTQLPPGTITALGIGPDNDKKIDKITGHLKLL